MDKYIVFTNRKQLAYNGFQFSSYSYLKNLFVADYTFSSRGKPVVPVFFFLGGTE